MIKCAPIIVYHSGFWMIYFIANPSAYEVRTIRVRARICARRTCRIGHFRDVLCTWNPKVLSKWLLGSSVCCAYGHLGSTMWLSSLACGGLTHGSNHHVDSDCACRSWTNTSIWVGGWTFVPFREQTYLGYK